MMRTLKNVDAAYAPTTRLPRSRRQRAQIRRHEEAAFAATLPDLPEDPADSRPSLPPSLSARYEDIRFVSEGGMGTVYRAQDKHLGRVVALKFLKGDDPDLWRRFIEEARAQARINHDHVCRVYEAGQSDGKPYIAMQYIEGDPLSRVRHRLTIEQAVRLMQEVASAVHQAHRLNIIHRDIKPANIMVEEQEPGVFKPYIMDFGLAREVDHGGQAQTGVVVGTPAYMSPEQARGESRAMDRRSDIYSLGVTLYDLLAGRTPFVAKDLWTLLMMVAYQDPPPLGKVKKGIPGDIETIVMKCLERDPARRYDSARALADDLQRFLDGDPIMARPASVRYVLWKKARKYRLVTGLVGALVAGVVAVGTVWVHAERQAEAKAQLGQELGEDVKEMELFLRSAYGLPLHDVERERDIVRRQLEAIERRTVAAGPMAAGPGHYALGVGHLALKEPDLARQHLEQAMAAGYASAELEYALGRAYGELFRRALEDTKRLSNDDERKKSVAEIEKSLRDPALLHLRAAVGARIEVPAYAEGLIALYGGNHEEAIRKARIAFEQAPWMYEAKKLEGDALFAEGSKYRHDAAFDYDKMTGYFEPAAQAYRVAAKIGRSDPDVHRAECELWEKIGWARWNKALPVNGAFETAEVACSRAVRSSSRDGKALVQRALVLLARTDTLDGDASAETVASVDQALLAAERSVIMLPGDVMAHYAIARARYQQAQVAYALGRDASMDLAIRAYRRALSLSPRFTWAMNELGDAYTFEARKAFASGQDGSELIDKALAQYSEASEVDPTFVMPVGGRLKAWMAKAEYEIEQGRDAEASLRALDEAAGALEKDGFGSWLSAFWGARADRLRGLRDLTFGRDPRGAVKAAEDSLRKAMDPAKKDYWLQDELARCRLIEAEHALRAGLEAAPSVAAAKDALRRAREATPSMSAAFRLLSAQVELAGIRAAAARRDIATDSFEAALDFVKPLVERPGFDAAPFEAAAEIYALRAEYLGGRGLDAQRADIERGTAMTAEALSRNPSSAKALFLRGRLELLFAGTSRDAKDRSDAARRAQDAFDAAFRTNPLLALDRTDASKPMQALVE